MAAKISAVPVALGVLLDTIIVRSMLVTALTLDVDRRMWWPGGLARRLDEPGVSPSSGSAPAPAGSDASVSA